MYYLFIFESIGTSELLLIAVVALMVFGPRKLPELARTIAKTMGEFRRSTDEFKRTWEKEVNLDGDNTNQNPEVTGYLGKPIERNSVSSENEIIIPEIKEIDKEDFDKNTQIQEVHIAKQLEAEKIPEDKRDWL